MRKSKLKVWVKFRTNSNLEVEQLVCATSQKNAAKLSDCPMNYFRHYYTETTDEKLLRIATHEGTFTFHKDHPRKKGVWIGDSRMVADPRGRKG